MRGKRVKLLRRALLANDGVLLLAIMDDRKCSSRCAMRVFRRADTRGDQGQRPKFDKPHGGSEAAKPAAQRPKPHIGARHRLVVPR